jgi:Putative Ig domain
MRYLALLATIAISLGGVACKSSPAAASTVPVAIAIFPTATQSVLPGGSITFTATVSNTSNIAVNWEVNQNVGGDAPDGLITTAGVYTAPSAVINPFDVTVTAQSQADTTKMSSTTVSIVLPPPVALDVTSLTLPAGGTHQFTATTTPPNLAVVWQVNGSCACGTITPGGLYTAPQEPPPGGTATIQAALQIAPAEFATATATVTYSNASLAGSYAFLLRGSDPSGLLLRAGSFTADGKGNITAGIEDINNGINLVQSGVSFTGTYTIGGDGRASIVFKDGFNGNTHVAGNSNFSTVIVSAQQAQMEELDTFASASGEADLQNTSSFNNASFHGEYTFDFSGADAANKAISTVGQFLADGTGGGANEAAQQDVNDNGALTSTTPNFSFQTVGANGRGLATLNGANYAFYMVSAAEAKFIAIGSPSSAVTAGLAMLQSGGPFNAVSLGGNSLIITNGSSATGPVSAAANFFAQANPNTFSSGALTINNTGNVSSASFTGTYAVNPATGRGTATLTTGQTYVFYMIGVNQAVIQETDSSSVSDGSLLGLTGGPFAISAGNEVNGFALQLTGIAAGQGEQDAVGQIDLIGGQVATGTVDINTAGGAGAMTAFTPTPGVAIPAGTTYDVTNNQGPLNVTVNGTNLMFQAYFTSPSSLFLLRTDTTDTRVLHGNLYQDISLAPAIVSANSVQFSVSVQDTFTVVAVGIPAATITESGALPSGVTFDQNTGILSGTPAAGTGGTLTQSYPITFTATNGVGSPAVQNFTLTVVQCVETSGNCS